MKNSPENNEESIAYIIMQRNYHTVKIDKN
jgi:hypothetical protein